DSDISVLEAELHGDVETWSRGDSRPWRPLPPGSADSPYRVTNWQSDPAVFSEENPQDIRKGESFAAEVINRVMHGKGWEHTLLIWVYDEGGGYYDHVPPPAAVPPDNVPGRDAILSWPAWVRTPLRPFLGAALTELANADAGPRTYDRLGFRVPAVIVSPYARPDFVTSTTFDHTSILKLVEQKWNLPALTRRDATAQSPLEALDLDGPPAFLTPPELSAPSLPRHFG
ncbi:MAG TPA: alkaline phosphatase family protein, partial [Streptosporangiaceae bacterium]|nr:alkaline phosphatase family protein [Streptosporangiaceae bacterium]